MWRLLLVLFLFSSLKTPFAYAQEPSIPLIFFSEHQFRERLILALKTDRAKRNQWVYGWTIGFYALGGVQTGMALGSHSHQHRVDNMVDATSSVLSAIATHLSPIRGDLSEPWNEKMTTRELSRYLHEYAHQEDEYGGWIDQIVCLAIASGAGPYLWKGEDRPKSALFTFSLNLLLGEIQIFTAPKSAKSSWQKLQAERYVIDEQPIASLIK